MNSGRGAAWALFEAAKKGDAAGVAAALKACEEHKDDFKKLINLRFGEDDQENPLGATSLYIAIVNGHLDIARQLLEAGADPNIPSREFRLTAVFPAVIQRQLPLDQQVEFIKLLQEYGAKIYARDSVGNGVLHYASRDNPEIVKPLSSFRDLSGYSSLSQGNIIDKYNTLFKVLRDNKLVKNNKDKPDEYDAPLSREGVCDGLSKQFIFYAKQGRIREFEFYIKFISTLDRGTIKKLAREYKLNQNIGLNGDDGYTYKFSKLIDFMKGVRAAQETTLESLYMSIKANVDASTIVAGSPDHLAQMLLDSRIIQEGEFKKINNTDHVMAAYRENGVLYFYDANHAGGVEVCRNESELAAYLKSYVTDDKYAIFVMHDLSYGDVNRELYDILEAPLVRNLMEQDFAMDRLRALYMKRAMTRYDFVYGLIEEMNRIKHENQLYAQFDPADFESLQNNLSTYLQKLPHDFVVDDSYQDINARFGKEGWTLLQYMVGHNEIQAAKTLIENHHPDLVRGDYNGNTALHFAVSWNNATMVRLLLDAGASLSVKNTKGVSPIALAKDLKRTELVELFEEHLAQKLHMHGSSSQGEPIASRLAALFKTYAHPPMLSFHWRQHRELADRMMKTLLESPSWDASDCAKYISSVTSRTEIKDGGGFKRVLDDARRMIDAEISPAQNERKIQVPSNIR